VEGFLFDRLAARVTVWAQAMGEKRMVIIPLESLVSSLRELRAIGACQKISPSIRQALLKPDSVTYKDPQSTGGEGTGFRSCASRALTVLTQLKSAMC
jgi:hypothetical protein